MATATVVPGSIVVEVLNQDNYEQWSFRVKTYLLAKDLWDIIVEAPTQEFGDEAVEDKVWTKKNAEALYAIQISCGTDIFTFIKNCEKAKDAWYTLENRFCSELKSLDTPGSENKDQREIDHFETFLKDVKSGDWGKAQEFLAQQPDAVRARSSLNGTTALHVAISAGHLHIVKELLQLMTEKDLEITDGYGVSTFGCALRTGTIQMVGCLVEKNKQIVSKRLTSAKDMNMTPVLVAYKEGNWAMARYLYSVTPVESLIEEIDGCCDGAELISRCFLTHEFDIAWDLIQHHPDLAITKDYSGCYPFNALASARSVFPIGYLERLKFWQRWIYDSIYKHYPTPTTSDICCVNVFEKQEDDKGNQTGHILSVIRGFFQAPVANLLQHLGIKCIYDMKLVHIHTRKILQCMCKAVKNKQLVQVPCLREAIFKAVERGHVEFIDLLGEANPDLLRVTDGKGRNILQHAIESRQAKVYDFIYKHDNERKATVNSTDTCNNGILHAAGNLYPHLDRIKGAPLQMQSELQWFKEVESIAPANVRELTNYTDNMTARELFSKNHKELVKKGEKSLKATATSCTVAGTLIVTMMFAASFTVPGGIRGDTGLPMFLKKPLFTVFIISDSISLSASTTSVIIFLGILTSRYAEKDFLTYLPTKLILGLFTLFLSIVTMMIAFSCALVIMLHRESWIFIPIISLASVVPIFSFGLMQYPLLHELFVSTYVRRMFEKKIKH